MVDLPFPKHKQGRSGLGRGTEQGGRGMDWEERREEKLARMQNKQENEFISFKRDVYIFNVTFIVEYCN